MKNLSEFTIAKAISERKAAAEISRAATAAKSDQYIVGTFVISFVVSALVLALVIAGVIV